MKDFPNDKATREWLSSQKKSTKATYKTCWKYFLQFTGMTGDQILESKRNDQNYTWEKRVLEFKRWIIEEKGKSEKTGTTSAAAVRAFFSFHRKALEFRPIESRHLEEAKPKYEDYRFSRDDLKKMASVGDLIEQYVVVVGKSFGMRAGDFLKLTRGDLEAYIDRPTPIFIGEYDTQKEGVKAFPFIDRDAKPIVKLMLEKMDREGRKNPDDRMLDYSSTIELTRVLRRVAEQAGIKHGNKRIRFHCLRKFLSDHLSSFMSESKWKQVVGKAISEGAYISPDTLRKDYTRAMIETCFTAERPSVEAQKQLAYNVLKTLGLNPEKLLREKAKDWKRPMTTEEEAKFLTEKMAEIIGKRKTEPVQKVVSEDELPNHLSHGWRVAAVLNNGKVVVERNSH
jgi:integrase